MQKEPFFSIILPTYNRLQLLKEAVASILSQSWTDWELIIVDDGSTDGTGSWAKTIRDERVRYVHQFNQERAAARRNGFLLARGRFLCFLDDDDGYYPRHLKVQRDFIVQHLLNEQVIYGGGYALISDRKRSIQAFIAGRYRSAIQYVWLRGANLISYAIPRSALVKEDFVTTFNQGEDQDLMLRLACRLPFSYHQDASAWVRVHKGRSLHRKFLQNGHRNFEKHRAAFERMFEDMGPCLGKHLRRREINRFISEVYFAYASGLLKTGDRQAARPIIKALRQQYFCFPVSLRYLATLQLWKILYR